MCNVGPLWKGIQLEDVATISVEPDDVDCQANDVHAQSYFHLQRNALFHLHFALLQK